MNRRLLEWFRGRISDDAIAVISKADSDCEPTCSDVKKFARRLLDEGQASVLEDSVATTLAMAMGDDSSESDLHGMKPWPGDWPEVILARRLFAAYCLARGLAYTTDESIQERWIGVIRTFVEGVRASDPGLSRLCADYLVEIVEVARRTADLAIEKSALAPGSLPPAMLFHRLGELVPRADLRWLAEGRGLKRADEFELWLERSFTYWRAIESFDEFLFFAINESLEGGIREHEPSVRCEKDEAIVHERRRILRLYAAAVRLVAEVVGVGLFWDDDSRAESVRHLIEGSRGLNAHDRLIVLQFLEWYRGRSPSPLADAACVLLVSLHVNPCELMQDALHGEKARESVLDWDLSARERGLWEELWRGVITSETGTLARIERLRDLWKGKE